MLNRVSIAGVVEDAPEIVFSRAGIKIVKLRIRVTESWKDKHGAPQHRRTWVPTVIINDGLAKIAEERVFKGSKVFVEGQWQTRKYTDNAGIERLITEVILGTSNTKLIVFSDAGEPGDMEVSTASEPGY